MSAAQWDRKDTDEVAKAVLIAGLGAVLVEATKAGVEELQGWLYRRRKRARKAGKKRGRK